nr:MAG TPA: PolyVal ADP-Ribosyltransferase [Caudoviricetes sp.]
MAQQRKRTAGDDLRDFKAGKISGNFYHNGIDRSDNYIQHTSAPRYITDENGKTQVASYNEWIQQEVFQHQHELANGTSSASSNNKTATNDTSVKNSNNTSSSTSSNIKSFFNENLDKANSSAENFKEAIKNPNKSLDDRVKGLTHMYNAAVATGDTKTAEKMQKEYDELADRVNKQTEINRQNVETAEAENAKLAEQAEKEQRFTNKYKNSTLEQRKNARIHATTEELEWLNKHMYDNSSSKELEDYNNQLNKEANSLWNQRDEEQAYNRLKAIEDEQGKLKTAIDNAKLSEQKKKEYDDIVNNDIKAKTVLQKYYALQEYSSNQSLVRSEENTDDAKNQVILDDYNYINKLSGKERNQIVKDFNNLKKEGYDTESLYKWYKRERDAESAAETTRVYTDYADKHPVLGSLQSVGVRLTGAVPDAIKYISTELDKKYNGGDGYINPEETGTAISDAMRAKVSENINNDFGSFLYNTGMSMADFASLLPLNAVPGGQALSLGIMGTSAGVGAANDVINNGGTIDNAVKTGIAAGIAETLFEKVSLEQLSVFKASGKSTFRAAVGNVLKGAFTEGSEEAFTDLANRLTDDAINKDLSSYNLAKKNYMEQGMSKVEAENAASWNFWKNVGLDFAGGAISGGVLNLATAGINLGGVQMELAQNKESNIADGKKALSDENFDLDLLIRQGLVADKDDKAYNLAKRMQKSIDKKGRESIEAADVGNLRYLIGREISRNPKLINKIAQVEKQGTQEQSNVQSEQNPTQQNTVQNGQQNAEQTQGNTVIDATKKADTEAIGKMYGAYAFGKNHPNGIIATDTSTGKVVKVALKSLESSSKINRSDEENTLVFNTNDGKQVNADSITFSDSQLDTIVHSANEFDTYGARNYISNFEEWRESPQAQKMSDDEMLYKYNRAYSAAYSFGREGIKLDSLKETAEYKILTNILGEQIVSQALSTGRRDVDINTQHYANRLTELINRNGRADTSGVTVYADNGTDVSHIPQELINTLGNLATKTGRNIIISDRLADGVNGVARDGNIILSSEISSQKILATALHEAGHMIKKNNPTEWQTLSDFVADYLVRKGVDLNKMIDRTIERYGNRLQADEHENTRDAALEEIVCDTLMSIASDEKALNIALSTKQNKSKIAAAIKSLIAKVKDWLIDKSQNYGAKAFAKDLEALENLAQRFSEAADTARENTTEQTEVQNGEKIDVEKYSIGSTDNIVQAKFDDNVNKKINNITQSKQFIRWFGDWQNSPAKASKAVDNNGEPLVLYHQTGKEFTTFDTKQKGSGEFDSEMPTGIFMKPTNNDIGVGGNIQMPLYASIKNPLIVNNRCELVKFYDKNVQGYTKAKSAIDSVNKEYKAKFNEEMKRENEEYQKLWNAKKNGEISEEEYQKSISRDALDEIMEEWENKVNEASHNAKALIDDYFKNSNYDGVIVNNDVGSFGRSTKTFIVFENTQVKSATDNIGTFDGNNPDIRYSLDEDYDFTDEKAGAIHDTLNFSIDDEYDDLFDFSGNGEQHIDFDKAIDKNNPELTIEQIYHHSARNVKEGLLAGQGIKPEQKKIYNMVKSVMRSYHINPNAETDSLITEYVDALNTFIDSIQNDKSNFTDAFEDFVLKCRDTLRYSTQLDEQHEAWAKEIRDELKGTTLLIPENAIDTIKENYGSVGKYKKALFGKINVKLEHNAKGINGNAVGSYIEDIGSHLENIGGRSLMIEDGFEWDSDSGYRMLDHIMNYVLAPQYVATYDGKFQSESTIDAAAIQMAFDTTAEYLKQQGKAAVMQNNIDKKKLRDINKALRQAEKAKAALNQKTIENYKTDIAEQKAKYNEQRDKYRQAYNALKDKKSEEAKRYRDKIHELEKLSTNQKAIIKTVKDTFRAQYTEKREQTKYMQMLGKKFDKLVKKFDAKSKNTENIPESLKRPILNVLIGFKESADPGQYKNGGKKTIPKYFGAWNNVAEIGEQVRNLYEEYKSLAPKPKDKSEDNPAPKGMQYSYIDINTIAYNEQTAQMLEIITDQFAEYATDDNGETIYDADGKPIKIGYKNIFDLDSADLKLLYDTMTALEASLTQATEIIVNGQRESIAGAAAKALDEISNVNYNKDVNINVLSKNTVGNKINAALSDMKELSNRFVATSLDPVRYGRFLSGYNDDSIVAKLFKDLHDGDVKREKIMQKAYTKVQSVAYQYSEKDLAKIQKNDVKEFDFRDTETGERVKVSQGIIMSIYLTDQQSSGRRHLLADRLNHYTVLPDLDSANSRRHSKQEKAKSENHHKVRFTFEDLQHIKRYVESNKMLREISGAISEVLNNELSQEINEVSMSKYGMLIATVRNYFPISVYGDGAAYEKDFSAEFNDLRMKSRGFIKRRENSYAPIVIDDVFRVFNRHTNSVAEWCGLTTPIENFKKVYNWINTNSLNGTTLHEAIMDKYGKAAEHYIDKLMGDLQKSKDTIDNNWLTRMQGNYMGAVLLLNPGAMIKQFAAFPTANAYFGTKNVAIASAGGMWKVNLEKYAEYTPYLWYRAEGNGTVVGELSRETGVVGGLKDKIDIMGKVDRYVVGCLLKAAELHVEHTTNLKKGSDAFYKEVVKRFEKCVDETQPNNMVTSKPQFIRNNYLKILSMNAFRSQTMAIGNTIIDSYMEYRTKSNDYKLSKSAENKSAKKVAMKKFAKALIGATESALLIGGLTTLVNMLLWHKWDDERDDKGNVTAENIFKSILDYSMESFAGTFTFGDTAYSAIAHKIDNDRPFYGLDSMSLENVNNFIENISKGKYILAATLLGDCFGFPASNIKRMALSLTSYFTDLTKGRGEIISDNKGNINTTVLVPLMINATIDGDADKAQYYEQLYVNTIMDTKGKTEKEARDMLEQKVIKALSKNNDDIEKAAVARANGDLNTYESLINKVSSYGFGKDDVIKASDKVISNIIANMKKEGITDEDAAKSDLVDNQGFTEQGAEYVWKKMSSSTDNEKSEESIFDSTGNDDTLMYKYTDAFEYLKNGDTANYEKVEKYLMERKGKTKNQMKKLMQSASRTDPIFEKYIEASKNNDADTTHTLYRQLLNIYGSESKFKSALRKYQDKVKKQQSK